MMQPGFHSSDPSTWASTKEYAKIEKLQEYNHSMVKERNMETDKEVTMDEVTMNGFADIMTSFLESEQSRRFMLAEPLTLTVKKKDGSYSKRPHVGGEEFKVARCYVGKRAGLIYVFKPVDVADYVEMEMPESQAKTSLGGFAAFIGKVGGSEFDRLKRDVMQKASLDAEREKMADRHDVYADLGFGSW
jgi:hypothetical protein